MAWHSFDILGVLPQIAPTLGIRSYMSVNYPDHEFIGAPPVDSKTQQELTEKKMHKGPVLTSA